MVLKIHLMPHKIRQLVSDLVKAGIHASAGRQELATQVSLCALSGIGDFERR